MHGQAAPGPSRFEARRRGERLRVTVMDMRTPLQYRHCEHSEAIQNPCAETVWIASLR
jgi:hypothetical protein